ncbi:MAG: bifunctional tetrahydrofolate synthase/dihydrofolate synthase [Burkholderiales bacterium]|nr:bifunctional tetrahydrofolate synthase/dihydrofolate synthase [Burkholderiales bacterium]
MSPQKDEPAAMLAAWLERIERLHPRQIELGLERVRLVAERMALRIEAISIIVGGTNGKGSTCAMLESILLAAGYRVGCYTSPHLMHFNERARINGEAASDEQLIEQFEAVEAARGDSSLTWFEFTTLAILRLFERSSLDVLVLEVGMGGRLDAVNIVDADCSIVTCIDIDHAEFLGDTREAIGFEKAHIYRPGRPAICTDPVPPQSLIDHASSIGADLWRFGQDFNYSGDRQQWSYGGRSQRRNSLAYPALRGANQLLNASGVLAALEALRARLPVSAQAIRQGLASVELPGRFQVLAGRPAVVLDVGHNPHAAAHLAANLDNMGFFPYTFAVFGMLADKDIDATISHLRSRVDHWLCVDLSGPRGSSAADLAARLRKAGVIPGEGGDAERTISCFASPREAFAAAQERAGENDRIVVFGSFLTVADVLAARGGRSS